MNNDGQLCSVDDDHTLVLRNSQPKPASAQPVTSPFFNFTGDLTQAEMQMAHQAASDIAQRMAEVTGLSAEAAFLGVFDGPLTLHKYTDRSCTVGAGCRAWASLTETTIYVGKEGVTNHYLFIHEIFHLLDIVVLGNAANEALLAAQQADPTFPNRPNLAGDSNETWGFAGGNFSNWQKSRSGVSGEEYADMGIGWTYNQWEVLPTGGWSADGQARADFMNVNMAIWLNELLP